MDNKEALRIEKAKRKAVARYRTCIVLAILNVALFIYIILQIIFIARN